jgi:hypothetical protein
MVSSVTTRKLPLAPPWDGLLVGGYGWSPPPSARTGTPKTMLVTSKTSTKSKTALIREDFENMTPHCLVKVNELLVSTMIPNCKRDA